MLNTMHESQSSGADMSADMTDTMDADGRDNQDHDSGAAASMQSLGYGSRCLIQVIQRIEALQITNAVPSLPRFVVCGDQSHGKSSIVEGICNIKLPRGEGTCTRCPIQITTSASKDGAAWSCAVFLHRRFMYKPAMRGGKPQWEAATEPNHLVAFATIDDMDQLENVLRLAQIAILNPHMDPKQVLQNSHSTATNSLDFSPNVVSLQITGPDLPELSFYDLPGAINMYEGSSGQQVVKLVEALIKMYVKDESALILLAISANQDIQTSTAFRYVRECNALSRCMGVLTKPDLVGRGGQQIRQILNGSSFKLDLGWYVTKQPSQEQLDEGITHSHARELEHEFFSHQEPWCEMPEELRSRFGTPSLQQALSKTLTDHILAKLPEIMQRVKVHLDKIEAQISQFPEHTRFPCQAISREITALQLAITKQLNALDGNNKFRGSYKKAIVTLQRELKDNRPEVTMSTPGFQQPVIDIEGIEEGCSAEQMLLSTPPVSRKRLNNGSFVTTPRSRASGPPAQPPSAQSPSTPRKPRTAIRPSTRSSSTNVITLDDIKDILDSSEVHGLPDAVDRAVTERMMMRFLLPWRSTIDAALENVTTAANVMLESSVDVTLECRKSTKLWSKAADCLNALLHELVAEVTARVHHMLTCETFKPITYDIKKWKEICLATKTELLQERLATRVNEYFDQADAISTNKITAQADRDKKAADLNWVNSNIGPDPYAKELEWIAHPLAYYDLASSRVVDVVAMHLEFGLLHSFDSKLLARLEADLRVNDSDYCAELLVDDPERERTRLELLAEKAKLLQALEELKALPTMAYEPVALALR